MGPRAEGYPLGSLGAQGLPASPFCHISLSTVASVDPLDDLLIVVEQNHVILVDSKHAGLTEKLSLVEN